MIKLQISLHGGLATMDFTIMDSFSPTHTRQQDLMEVLVSLSIRDCFQVFGKGTRREPSLDHRVRDRTRNLSWPVSPTGRRVQLSGKVLIVGNGLDFTRSITYA